MCIYILIRHMDIELCSTILIKDTTDITLQEVQFAPALARLRPWPFIAVKRRTCSLHRLLGSARSTNSQKSRLGQEVQKQEAKDEQLHTHLGRSTLDLSASASSRIP